MGGSGAGNKYVSLVLPPWGTEHCPDDSVKCSVVGVWPVRAREAIFLEAPPGGGTSTGELFELKGVQIGFSVSSGAGASAGVSSSSSNSSDFVLFDKPGEDSVFGIKQRFWRPIEVEDVLVPLIQQWIGRLPLD